MIMVGEPLPAHLLVLCGGSPRFQAQMIRWNQDVGRGASDNPPTTSPKALLRVPLGVADELPFALSAIRFLYTARLEDDDLAVEALLHIRRQAEYLQIEGCAAACDAALAAALTAPITAAPSPNPNQPHATALANLIALYTHHALLPDDPGSGYDVFRACRQQLVQVSGSVSADGPLGLEAGSPSLGELLAWAFRDAPSALSDPETRKQVEALPLPAMEALLRCDNFASDNESSVLLMVATWLVAFCKTTTDVDEIRARLCKLVRLSHLSGTYLHVVLPCLTWFPISPEEHRFLCDYTAATAARRARMAVAAAGLYDCGSAWYTTTVRQGVTGRDVRSYSWHLAEADLQAALAKDAAVQSLTVNAKFTNGAERVVSYGLEWYPYLQYDKGKDAAGVFLSCTWPAALGLQNTAKLVALVQPGSGGLEVHRRRGGDAVAAAAGATPPVAWCKSFDDDSYLRVGWAWGGSEALPLQGTAAAVDERKEEGQQQQLFPVATTSGHVVSALAPFAPYLQSGGKLSGRLWWVLTEAAGTA